MRNPSLAFALLLFTACPATEDQVKDTLTAMGFTDIERTHTESIGPRSRPRGRRMPRNRRPTIESVSRCETRYPAKNTASAILATSPG